MYYPKDCYFPDINRTRAAKSEYDKKRELWWKTCYALFPDYNRLPARERLAARAKVNKQIGFSV